MPDRITRQFQKYSEELLGNLGLLYSKFSFENIVAESEMRRQIAVYGNDTSNILTSSPDYFVMPRRLRGSSKQKQDTCRKQIFFIKLLREPVLTIKEHNTYTKFYAAENIVILFADFTKKELAISRYSDIRTKVDGGMVRLKFPSVDPGRCFSSMNLDTNVASCIENYSNSLFGR